ncbi:hypothetical protein GCM10010294_31620 [Streptomyces griseoloalbus]|uniref:hypothetical protein n=1 Tax=Streptomyces griseoloalbus TaxID=67303 RepID=UPI0018767EC8|nr:hypothetical protein GCM10010294_31620 [Streptomyces griseoloalbus]
MTEGDDRRAITLAAARYIVDRVKDMVVSGGENVHHGTVDSVEEVKGIGVRVRPALTVEVEGSAKPARVAQAVHRHNA